MKTQQMKKQKGIKRGVRNEKSVFLKMTNENTTKKER